MKLYLAGPMRGIPEFNFPAFFRYQTVLEANDHEVFNPAHHDMQIGFNPKGMTVEESLDEIGFDLRTAYTRDLLWICGTAEGVALMPGWEESAGANAEASVANALGLDLIILPALTEMQS